MKRFLVILMILGLLAGVVGNQVSHATIASLTSHVKYTGTGSQKVFPYTFKIYAASDLKVYLLEAGSYSLKTLNIDYTVSGLGVHTGGNVTMTTAPTASQTLIIFREPPLLQSQQFTSGGPFPAKSAEDSLDKIVAEIQGLDARTVKSPAGVFDMTLPYGAPTANGLYLRWNATGTAIEAVPVLPAWVSGFPLEMVNARDYGDGLVSYSSLSAAVAAIGAEERRLYLARGTWIVTANLTIPKNITVVYELGAVIQAANGITVIHNAVPEAGPYQIFSWVGTGAIDLQGSPTEICHLEWFGAQSGLSNTVTDAYVKALGSLGSHQYIKVSKGIWRFATAVVYQPATSYFIPNTVGDEDGKSSIFYVDLNSTTTAFTLGSHTSSYPLVSHQFRNINFVGPENSCKHVIHYKFTNRLTGLNNCNFIIGTSDALIRGAAIENSEWDYTIGHSGDYLPTVGIATWGSPYAGPKFAPDGLATWGLGTVNKFRVRSSFINAGVYNLWLENGGGAEIAFGDLENAWNGETSHWSQGLYDGVYGPAMYAGATTRIAQTFTITEPTVINNIGFVLQSTLGGGASVGPVSAEIYSTAGAPAAVLHTSYETISAGTISGGNFNFHLFRFHGVTLAAGTYAISAEFTTGNATNYLKAEVDSAGTHGGTCYTYDGAWHAQTYDLMHVVNAQAAIVLKDLVASTVHHQQIESNWRSLLIDNCRLITIRDMTNAGVCEITRSKGIQFEGTNDFSEIRSDPTSSLTFADNYSQPRKDTLAFNYGDTLYGGLIRDWFDAIPPDLKGNSLANLIDNHEFKRWTATPNPDGYPTSANLTWLHTGDGLGDTTRHPLVPDAAKITVTATGDYNFKYITGDDLKKFRGNSITFTVYVMWPSGQTWTASNYFNLYTTCPAWTGATQYNVGDSVGAAGAFVCVVGGTSGGVEPVWGGVSANGYISDGSVLWHKPLSGLNNVSVYMDSSWADNKWRRIIIHTFVPGNATAFGASMHLNDKVEVGDTALYSALPTLNYGFIPIQAVQSAANEARDYIQIGKNRLYMGYTAAPVDGRWCEEGDIYLRGDLTASQKMGWGVDTSGTAGGTAVFKDLPSLGP
jgi:hypothetical protein